jgi:UDP-GlcNAc3NAcA epimerase
VTLRDETEWTELVEAGWNRLAPPGKADINEVIPGAMESRDRNVRPAGLDGRQTIVCRQSVVKDCRIGGV